MNSILPAFAASLHVLSFGHWWTCNCFVAPFSSGHVTVSINLIIVLTTSSLLGFVSESSFNTFAFLDSVRFLLMIWTSQYASESLISYLNFLWFDLLNRIQGKYMLENKKLSDREILYQFLRRIPISNRTIAYDIVHRDSNEKQDRQQVTTSWCRRDLASIEHLSKRDANAGDRTSVRTLTRMGCNPCVWIYYNFHVSQKLPS